MTSKSASASSWLRNSLSNGIEDLLSDRQGRSDGSSYWARVACPCRVQYIQRLHESGSQRISIAVSDGKHLVRALLTKDALTSFQDGLGKPFSACHPGEMLKLENCQFRIPLVTSDEENVVLHIFSFGLVQGSEPSINGHASNLTDDIQIKTLLNKLFEPEGLVTLPDDEEPDTMHQESFMSQVPHAQAVHQSRRQKLGERQVEVDGSLNLAAPIRIESTTRFNVRNDERLSNEARSNLPTQALNVLNMLSSSKQKVSSGSDDEAKKMGNTNVSEVSSSALHKTRGPSRNTCTESRQRKILQTAASWQYPVPNVSQVSKLLPPEILHEFRTKYYDGHLRPRQSKSGPNTPTTRRNAVGKPTRGRSVSEASDRSGEPVAWSPSPPPNRPAFHLHPDEDVHDEAFRPPDSSGQSMGNGDRHIEAQPHLRGQSVESEDTSNDDNGSDSGLDETVPHAVGDQPPSRDKSSRAHRSTSPQQAQASPALVPGTDHGNAVGLATLGAQERQRQKPTSEDNDDVQQRRSIELGFQEHHSVIESPRFTARRERREFLHGRRDGTKVTGLLASLTAIQPKHGTLALEVDGQVSRPSSQGSRVTSRTAEQPEAHYQETNQWPKPIHELDQINDIPNKRRRLEQGARDIEATPSYTSGRTTTVRGSRQSSPGGMDTFPAFVQAYEDYDGGRKHFVSMCREIEKLGKGLHRSLWDDYVVRNLTDYDESCGLSYRDYYDDHVEEPAHTQRILNPTSLKSVLEGANEKERSRASLTRPGSIARSEIDIDRRITHRGDVDENAGDMAQKKTRTLAWQANDRSPSSKPRPIDSQHVATFITDSQKALGTAEVTALATRPPMSEVEAASDSATLHHSVEPIDDMKQAEDGLDKTAQDEESMTSDQGPLTSQPDVQMEDTDAAVNLNDVVMSQARVHQVELPEQSSSDAFKQEAPNHTSASRQALQSRSLPWQRPQEENAARMPGDSDHPPTHATLSDHEHAEDKVPVNSHDIYARQSVESDTDIVFAISQDQMKDLSVRVSREQDDTASKEIENHQQSRTREEKEARIQRLSVEADKLLAASSQSTESRPTPSRNAFASRKPRQSRDHMSSADSSGATRSANETRHLQESSDEQNQERETMVQEFARAYRSLKIHGDALLGEIPDVDVLEWDL